VEDGKAIWVDKKDICLILWKSVDEWADSVYSWCKNTAESVILVDDLCGHDGEMQGSDISGLPMALVAQVIACLEKSGRAKYVFIAIVLGHMYEMYGCWNKNFECVGNSRVKLERLGSRYFKLLLLYILLFRDYIQNFILNENNLFNLFSIQLL
jgi:hypothetical protein